MSSTWIRNINCCLELASMQSWAEYRDHLYWAHYFTDPGLFLPHPASYYSSDPVFLKFLKVLGKFVLLGISKIPPSHFICTVSEVGISTELDWVDIVLSMKSLIQSIALPCSLLSEDQLPYVECYLKMDNTPIGPPRPAKFSLRFS